MRTRHLVEARVVDDAGQPYLGARLTPMQSAPGETAGLAAGLDTNLAQGYALPGSYTVRAGRGAVLSPQTVEVPHAGPIEVVMRRETTLSGVVRDTAGKPVSGVVLFVEDHDDPAARVQTPNDRNGAFTLGGGSRRAGHKAKLWVYSGCSWCPRTARSRSLRARCAPRRRERGRDRRGRGA